MDLERFTDKADNYARFRPSYPSNIVDILKEVVGLSEESVVADIGCGTGIFSGILLQTNCTVLGVEPNASMRKVAEDNLSNQKFKSFDGSAENTLIEE